MARLAAKDAVLREMFKPFQLAQYPLYYSMWRRGEEGDLGLTKLDLSKQMLLMLRENVSCRLWVAMDHWYFMQRFFCIPPEQ